jgi:hypothetical protein
MAKPVDEIPAPPKDMTRFEAQRRLGLFAKWDVTMLVLVLLTWTVIGFYWLFRPEPKFDSVILGFLVSTVLLLAWAVVLLYRVLVFLLDLHADISLMPEAAARIAAGYFEGRRRP